MRRRSPRPKRRPARDRAPANVVHVSVVGGPHRGADREVLRRRAHKMMVARGLTGAEVSVVLTDEPSMKKLNAEFRKIERSTDVLAFAMNEGEPLVSPDGGLEMWGDVVICVPVARRNAKTHGCTLLQELTTLLAHGLLHLLGFDHATQKEEREMTARCVELADAAGRRAS